MCVDYTKLNKAGPKDQYSLVDGMLGCALLSFMDANFGYNQIKMHRADEEKIDFIVEVKSYCFKVMLFELKNVRARY